jgi:hypothetical protein
MEEFGVRFQITDESRFQQFWALFNEIKHDKDAEAFRDPEAWLALVPEQVKNAFILLTSEERADWQTVRPETIVRIDSPSAQLGSTWVFDRVFESIADCEYSLLCCQRVEANIAEIHIDPYGYPYGGVGAWIALIEAFGFLVLGINECGKYESRKQLY